VAKLFYNQIVCFGDAYSYLCNLNKMMSFAAVAVRVGHETTH